MGEERSQIEREISAERHSLDRHLSELQEKANELRDWRFHYRHHVGAALGLAFGGGLILAAMLGGPSRRSRSW